MTQEEFDAMARDAGIEMKKHVMPCTTPIGKVTETEPGEVPGTTRATKGELWGSGNYLTYKDKILILTNEHVAQGAVKTPLTHLLYGDVQQKTQLLNGGKFPAISHPTDAAITAVDQRVWDASQHSARTISMSEVAENHAPVPGELLFFVGYSGARSTFAFDYLHTPSTSYACQEVEPRNVDPAVFMPSHHFALDYRPDQAKTVELGGVPLPLPRGFSGACVWDTKRVACYQAGREWSPSCAKVTGLIWGWPSGAAALVATKIEYVRAFIQKGFSHL